MILGNSEIEKIGKEVFEPFNPKRVQPASYDLSLGTSFIRYGDDDFSDQLITSGPFTIMPGECVLASTVEYVKVPNNVCIQVDGKSSYGRLFMSVHQTAGFVDPGFEGNITLELVNHSKKTITIMPGKPIAQAIIWTVKGCTKPYGHKDYNNHYQKQENATRSYLDE